MAHPREVHPLPLATRVAQLRHELVFRTEPTVMVDREELTAILGRYEAMHSALIRALHELNRVSPE